MRYASTYDQSGAPVVAELQGDRLVPLAGLAELGEATTAEVLAAAERRTADAFPAADATLRAVVPNPAKVICVGLNYKAHIEETGRSDSDYPVLFPKFASSLAAANAAIDISGDSAEVDYEGELTVVIGKPGRRISEADARTTCSATPSAMTFPCATTSTRRTSGCRARPGTAAPRSARTWSRRTRATSPRSASPPR